MKIKGVRTIAQTRKNTNQENISNTQGKTTTKNIKLQHNGQKQNRK